MSYSGLLVSLSNFADEAVILPLSLAVGLTFIFKWRRAAVAWFFSVITTLGLVVILKFVFYILSGVVNLGVGLRSPSSHAAAGALVYGTLLALLVRGSRASQLLIVSASCFFALFFSLTRIELRVHTRSEVIVGSILGVCGAYMFAHLAKKMPYDFSRLRLGIVAAVVIVSMYGTSWSHGEIVIKHVAYNIQAVLEGKKQ